MREKKYKEKKLKSKEGLWNDGNEASVEAMLEQVVICTGVEWLVALTFYFLFYLAFVFLREAAGCMF